MHGHKQWLVLWATWNASGLQKQAHIKYWAHMDN